MFVFGVCQNKALSGFTHGVYCEGAECSVRSGHATVANLLMLGEEMKTPS